MTDFKRLASLFLSLLLILSCVFLETSCGNRTFRFKEMGITLPSSFEEKDVPREVFDKAYSDGDMIVGFTRMSFMSSVMDGLPDTLTPRRFAEYYIERAVIYTELKMHGLVPYCIYTLGEAQTQESFLLSFYRTDYAYFIITFTVMGEFSERNIDRALSYVDTVFYTE